MLPRIEPPQHDALRSGITWFNPQAGPLFERALWHGTFNRLIARVRRRSWRLLLLADSISTDMIYQAQPGTNVVVELDAIRGSINRCDDFERSFYPLNERLQNRWVRIASMMLQETALPPVDLIRVGGIYFVVDGHHRISVARMFKFATIDAVINAAYL